MGGRWPIHPRPYPAEALSSWLNRLAEALGAHSAAQLLHYEFGIPFAREIHEWLDFDPSSTLIDGLAFRTGEHPGAIRAMTARGYVPLLIDSLLPGAFDEYVGQTHLLLPEGTRSPQGNRCLPWYSPERFAAPHGCGRCLKEHVVPYLRLFWRFSWMATCPIHNTVLEPVWQLGAACRESPPSRSRVAEEPIRVWSLPEQVMADSMTHQAVTTGLCHGPHGSMHGGAWLRLLRSVIQEVTIAPSRAGRYRWKVEQCWQRLGLRYETPHRRPFEQLPVASQVTILNVAAVALAHELKPDSSAPYPPGLNELAERCIAEFRVNSGSLDAFRRMIGGMDKSGGVLESVDRHLITLGLGIPFVTKTTP